MNVQIRLHKQLYAEIMTDLRQPHPFAAERIGFALGRATKLGDDGQLVLLTGYHSIPDEQYLEDPFVGARIGPDAITWAMQAAYHGRNAHEGVFHVHLHHHLGEPGMSRVDVEEIPKLIPGFQTVGASAPHGLIILSLDHAAGWVWFPGSSTNARIERFSISGAPIRVFDWSGRL